MSNDRPMKMVNGELMPLSDEDTAQRERDLAEFAKSQPAETEPKVAKSDVKRRSK